MYCTQFEYPMLSTDGYFLCIFLLFLSLSFSLFRFQFLIFLDFPIVVACAFPSRAQFISYRKVHKWHQMCLTSHAFPQTHTIFTFTRHKFGTLHKRCTHIKIWNICSHVLKPYASYYFTDCLCAAAAAAFFLLAPWNEQSLLRFFSMSECRSRMS